MLLLTCELVSLSTPGRVHPADSPGRLGSSPDDVRRTKQLAHVPGAFARLPGESDAAFRVRERQHQYELIHTKRMVW